MLAMQPNKRLKLAAPSCCGSLVFVKSSSRRRSLGRIPLGSRNWVHLMRVLRYIAVILFLLVGGLWIGMRVVPRWQARQLTPVMSAYLRAAATGDSAGLTRVTASPAPVRWGLLVHREAPAFLDEAARRARPEWIGYRRGPATGSV